MGKAGEAALAPLHVMQVLCGAPAASMQDVCSRPEARDDQQRSEPWILPGVSKAGKGAEDRLLPGLLTCFLLGQDKQHGMLQALRRSQINIQYAVSASHVPAFQEGRVP